MLKFVFAMFFLPLAIIALALFLAYWTREKEI
jgi:hypothetical protein